jgi:phage replication initiation protein
MTKFYGQSAPITTAQIVSTPKFSISHVKRLTIPTLDPWLCVIPRDVSNTSHISTPRPHSDSVPTLKEWQKTNDVQLVIGEDGKPTLILVSSPAAHEIAIVDWVTFSFKRYTFVHHYVDVIEEHVNDVCVFETGKKLESIFGFTIGKKKKSALFYEMAYEILTPSGVPVGELHIGGQHSTITVSLSGNACKLGDYGWQDGLYNFLKSANGGRITRLDLAHDDIEGKYLDIDQLNDIETAGGFYRFGKPPSVTLAGDWKYNDRDNKGRTLYVGSRTSDKFLRAYQKGKQLGDKSSKWVRLEVELKAKHTIIPLDALINPSDYFINLYPCFKDLFQYSDQKQSVIKYVKKTSELTIQKAKDNFINQYGKYLGFFRNLLGDTACLDDLSVAGTPKRLLHLLHDYSRVHPDFCIP